MAIDPRERVIEEARAFVNWARAATAHGQRYPISANDVLRLAEAVDACEGNDAAWFEAARTIERDCRSLSEEVIELRKALRETVAQCEELNRDNARLRGDLERGRRSFEELYERTRSQPIDAAVAACKAQAELEAHQLNCETCCGGGHCVTGFALSQNAVTLREAALKRSAA